MTIFKTLTRQQQELMIRARWQKLSRLGLLLYMLAFGTPLLLWMALCFVGFMYLHGTQRLLHQPFILESAIPCMALIAYFLPLIQYLVVRTMVNRLGPESPEPSFP